MPVYTVEHIERRQANEATRRGIPGTLSQLALARADPALTRDIVMHAANVVAGGGDMLFRK